MATKDTIPEDNNRNRYWHTIYKVSGVLSPREEINTEFDSNEENTANKRLSLVSGNMDAEEELLLRSYLISKINTWSHKENNSYVLESSVVTFELSELIENVQAQLYYRAIKTNKSKDELDISYIICFLTASKSGLELFQKDLDKYSSNLVPYLEKYMESADISDHLNKVNGWYDVITPYVKNCLEVFDYGLATLLCAGLCGDTIKIAEDVPKEIKESVERFLECCSLSELFTDEESSNEKNLSSSSLNDLAALQDPETLFVKKSTDGAYTVTPRKNSTFCDDCIKQLKVNLTLTPIEMRQMVENYKLKCNRDMNTFRRLLTKAETDYYACYKTYLFLVTSGNGIVLMRNSRLQNNMENARNRRDLLDILERFVDKMGGYGVFDTKERKETLSNRILNL